MNYSFKTISALVVIASIGFASCSKSTKAIEEDKAPSVTSSNKEITVPEQKRLKPVPIKYQEMVKADKFKMNVSDGFSGTTKKGMKVNIPSDALVDENNNPVTGEVELEVLEYYSPAEIVVSNIPMEYMDGDELKHFQSDGMFTINASQKGKKLKVAKNKNIQLTTKRFKEGEGFEFYSLENNEWVKNTSNEISVVEVSTAPVVPVKPIRPSTVSLVKYNPNYYTIEKDQRTYLPEHNNPQMSERTKDYVKQITVDVTESPWILDKNKWHFDKKEHFILKKDDKKQKKYDTVYYTVNYAIRGNKKYKNLLEKQKEELAEYATKLDAYYEAKKAAGTFTPREYTEDLIVGQFGTYNIDRYFSQPKELLVEKKYDISLPQNISLNDKVFLLAKTGEGEIVPINLNSYPQLVRYNKTEQNAFIVLTEETVYAIKRPVFDKETRSQMSNGKFDFQLKEKLTFTSTEEFNQLLENLF